MGQERTGPYNRRLTVAQAADALGISAEAVRGRIRRGTLPVEREGGAVYVILEAAADARTTADQSSTTDDRPSGRTDQLIAEMQDRIRSLEEANRENRRIIAALTSRIPELEARESPVSSSEASEGTEPRSSTEGQHAATERPHAEEERPRRRSWWREFFGFGE